jgi:hypothetical protein
LSKRLASRVKEPDQKPKKASADDELYNPSLPVCTAAPMNAGLTRPKSRDNGNTK